MSVLTYTEKKIGMLNEEEVQELAAKTGKPPSKIPLEEKTIAEKIEEEKEEEKIEEEKEEVPFPLVHVEGETIKEFIRVAPSQQDYDSLPMDNISLDKRGIVEIFFRFCSDFHVYYNVFIYKNLLIPLHFRQFTLLTIIMSQMAFNAFFFNEEIIEARLAAKDTGIMYTLTNEGPLIVISGLLSTFVVIFVKMMIRTPPEHIYSLNQVLRTVNRDKIIEAYKLYINRLKSSTFFVILIGYLINLCLLYFIVIFCATYPSMAGPWVQNIVLGLFLDILAMKFVLPLLVTLVYFFIVKLVKIPFVSKTMRKVLLKNQRKKLLKEAAKYEINLEDLETFEQ